MSSYATKGKNLFAHATGHLEEQFDEFEMEFSDDEEDGETKTTTSGGAMSFGVVEEQAVQSQAIKPFIGAIFPPSNSATPSNAAPTSTLSLEYVFGYCKKTRSDVFSLGGGRTFWPAASVGVIHDSRNAGASSQSHLIGHRDEITAAAQSSASHNLERIATGSSQLTRKHEYPTTILWDTAAGTQMGTYQSKNLKRQVDALAFDASGQYIFAAGAGNKHNIVCYHVQDGEQAYISSGSSRVLAMDYDTSTNSLVVGGVKSLQFIPFANGSFGDPQRVGADTIISVTSSGNTTYCGGSNGTIVSYTEGTKTNALKAHKGGVYSIAVNANGTKVASGGKKGTVTLWNASNGRLTKVRAFTLQLSVPAKGLTFDGSGDLVVGSKAGRVVRVSTTGGSGSEIVLGSGHCDGETWGLA